MHYVCIDYQSGITRLIHNGSYKCAYPLHEGGYEEPKDSEDNNNGMNDRMVLYKEWASFRCWSKEQPLWLIRRYFGTKIGLYFAWLGFYTQVFLKYFSYYHQGLG